MVAQNLTFLQDLDGSSSFQQCREAAMSDSVVLSALFWGLLSAISLPLGALAGIRWRPHSKVVSTLMAFGAGALLFALSVELLGKVPDLAHEIGPVALVAGIGGALTGGVVFDLLNQMLNRRGAFLRNLSNAKEYIAHTKRRRARRVLQRLSRIEALRDVPPEDLANLVKHVYRRKVADGEHVFTEGETADEMFFVRRGAVRIFDSDVEQAETETTVVKAFDSFGELGVLTQTPRTTTAKAEGETVLYILGRDDIRQAAISSKVLQAALQQLAVQRAAEWRYRDAEPELRFLQEEAEDDLDEMNMPLKEQDYKAERKEAISSANVAKAIWLGIAIDAIPESLVIGTLAAEKEGMSIAFIAGVFLANFPEAMSSSVSMHLAGFGKLRILLMWGSLCLLTGIGAMAGVVLLSSASHNGPSTVILFVEGVAAGAMLTAIAETMLPEAFEQGGSIVGMATLCGFLVALLVAAL